MKRRFIYSIFFILAVSVTGSAKTIDQTAFVDSMKASCPLLKDDACIREAAKSYLGTSDVNMARQKLPLSGLDLLKIKGITMDHEGFYVTMDQSGRILPDNGRAARNHEWKLYVEKFGKLSQGLLKKLDATANDKKIPVGIWLSTPVPPSPNDKVVTRAQKALLEQAIAKGHQRFMDELTPMNRGNAMRSGLHPAPGVPAFTGVLSKAEINAISRMKTIAKIYYNPETTQPSTPKDSYEINAGTVSSSTPQYIANTTWVYTVNGPPCYTHVCLKPTGLYQTVCIISRYLPLEQDLQYLPSVGEYYTGTGSTRTDFPAAACSMINNSFPVSPNPFPPYDTVDAERIHGVAPGASCYFANWEGTQNQNIGEPVYNGCVANGYRIWNYGLTTEYQDGFFDYWVKHYPYPLITLPSGDAPYCDTDGSDYNPRSYNTMTVNQANDMNTYDHSDDTLDGSPLWPNWEGCWLNLEHDPEWAPGFATDRERPLISAPNIGDYVGNWYALEDYSLPAPIVAGVAAQIHQMNTALQIWPEAVRAILMTTAVTDLDGDFFDPDNSQIDEKDGAGEVYAVTATYLAGSDNYMSPENTPSVQGLAYGSLNFGNECTTNASVCANHKYFIQGEDNAMTRVTLVWEATAACTSGNDEETCTNDHKDVDLDIYVYDENTGLVAYSMSYDNNVEMVTFNSQAGHTYRVEIWRYDAPENSTWFGLAWYTSSMFHRNNP